MINKYYRTILLIAGMSLNLLTSQDFAPVGTAVAQFLEVGINARATGMGEAYTAITNDAGSAFCNPAGLAEVKTPSIFLANTTWPADISIGGVALAGHISRFGTLSFSIIYLMTDDMEITTMEESEGTGDYFSINNTCLGLSYARFLTDRVSIGVTGKLVEEKYYGHGYNTWSFDLGTMYRTDFHGLKIGMSILHFGPDVRFDGKYVNYSDQDSYVNLSDDTDDSLFVFDKFSLPVNFRVGLSMNILEKGAHRLRLATDMVHPNNNLEQYNVGMEYGINDSYYLRVGYKMTVDEGGFSLGGGIKTGILGMTGIRVDYSYSDLGILTHSHRFSLLLTL